MHGSDHPPRSAQAVLTTPTTIKTTAGEFPLHEYHLRLAGREWVIVHTGAMLTPEDEGYFFRELRERLPYGVALWPASIALAHELLSRADELPGRRVLELGAGTGLPGIVAASLGARVVQTDRHELPLSICRRNGERNAATAAVPIEHRLADWTLWDDETRYDVILGADILYGDAMQPHLRRIFEGNLAAGGRILLSDPIRPVSLKLLEELEADGWRITMSRWTVGETSAPRTIAVFELAAP